MTESPSPNLDELAKQLPALLSALDNAAKADASVDVQAKAFELGCSLLRQIVEALSKEGSELKALQEPVEGFTFGMPKESFDKFLRQEVELLRQLKFDEAQLRRASANIQTIQPALENAEKFDPAKGIDALKEFGQLLCDIQVYTAKDGMKFSTNLVTTVADGVIDVALVFADAIAVTVAGATVGPFAFLGVALGAVASVRSGVKGIGEKSRQIKDQLQREVPEQRLARLKERKK